MSRSHFRSLWRARRAALAFAVVLGCAGAQAQDALAPPKPVTGPRVVGIGFSGPIAAADVERLRNAVALAGEEPLPARLVVFFDSGGGDGLAAMQIGRLLRHARAHVFVTRRCASACVFAFAGGVYRSALPGTLGVHRARLTSTREGRTIDVDVAGSPAASQFFADAEAQIAVHLEEMGLARSLFDAMQAVPPQSMRWLSAQEAADFGLTGFDPDYLATRARELQARYGIPEAEVRLRMAPVLERCGEAIARHAEFIACYRRQLLSKP